MANYKPTSDMTLAEIERAYKEHGELDLSELYQSLGRQSKEVKMEQRDDEELINKFNPLDFFDGCVGQDDDASASRTVIDEELLQKAVCACMQLGVVSVSSIQRKLAIGFSKATMLVDCMKSMGIVSDDNKIMLSKLHELAGTKDGESEISQSGKSASCVKRIALQNPNDEEYEKIMEEFKEISKCVSSNSVPSGRQLARLIDEGKMPIQTVRGVKRLIEMSSGRSGEIDRGTFKKQIEALIGLPHSVFGETFDDFDTLEEKMAKAVLFNKPAIKKFIRAYKKHLDGSTLQGNVVVIVGPPKSGKSRLVNTLKEVAGQYVYSFDCGGISDSYAFEASSNIYTNGNPSRIVSFLTEAGISNPFIILDNVDKMTSGGKGGDPTTALAKWINKNGNHNYIDEFINVPIDLSSVNFILTAEHIQAVPPILKNQAVVIEMGNYERDEKVEICKRFIAPQAIADNGLAEDAIIFERDAVNAIINEKAFEPGLAELVKIVGDIVAKEADAIRDGDVESVLITAQYVDDYFKEGNAKDILRLTDSKFESFRRLAEVLPNYSKEEQDKIIKKAKQNEYFMMPPEEQYFDLLSRYPRGISGGTAPDYKDSEQLADDYFGAAESKEQLLTMIAKNKLSGKQDGIVVGLIGNPGVGKTNFAQFAAKLLGRPYVAISMANVVDPSDITGVRDKKIGKIAQAFIDAQSERPLILIDELEKSSHAVQNTFLTYLDPIQNKDLVDEYLGIAIPIQQAVIIATVNDTDNLNYPVYDRLDKIWMDDYTAQDKVEIAKRGAIAKYTLEAGLPKDSVVFSDEVLGHIAKRYGIGAGFRRMQKMLQRIIGACAREVLSKGLSLEDYKREITEKDVFEYLGEALNRERKICAKNKVGVVNGLAAGSLWGDVLPIEATVYPGKGEYDLTGSLGKVMQESALVARAAVRKLLADEGSDIDISKLGIHIHAPDGAQRKEGPSAGVAIAVALYSAITGCEVNSEYAMSGEINLQGEILPVGGLEQKLTAAFESGIKTVLLSEENREVVEKIDNHDIDKSRIQYIYTLTEALDAVLIKRNTSGAVHNI